MDKSKLLSKNIFRTLVAFSRLSQSDEKYPFRI